MMLQSEALLPLQVELKAVLQQEQNYQNRGNYTCSIGERACLKCTCTCTILKVDCFTCVLS